jgi:two-component system, OmpR family, sensor histidine kinase VicK
MIEISKLFLPLAQNDARLYFAYNLEIKRFIYINPAFESFFNSSLQELKLSTIMAMIHQDDIDYLKTCMRSLRPGSFDNDLEFRLISEDKKEFTFNATMFFDDSLKVKHILIGYLENITNFKANTLHLNEFKNKTDTILNILAHDLAAPLSNIKNLSFLLGNKLKTLKEEDIYKIISSIEKNSKTGIQIINEFVKQGIAETIGIELKR